MNIKNSFDITVSQSLIRRLQQTKETIEENFNSVTAKAQQVSDDWQQSATQSTENAIDKFNNTIEQAKGSFEENLPQISVQTVVNSSVADWFEQHPAFMGIIRFLNWTASHPIVSLIVLVFSLAILWSLIKAIGRLIETASLSILKVPLKLLGSLIKYCWRSLGKFRAFATNKYTDTKTINKNSELQLNNNTYQIISSNKQQRLKDISARLEEIQVEQQKLLKEAADILDEQKSHSSLNIGKGVGSWE